MKRTVAFVLLLLASFAFAGGHKSTGAHFVQCYKCRETAARMRGYSACTGCPAWRRYDLEEGQHGYMVYKCQHGHTLYIPYNGEEKR